MNLQQTLYITDGITDLKSYRKKFKFTTWSHQKLKEKHFHKLETRGMLECLRSVLDFRSCDILDKINQLIFPTAQEYYHN